MRCTKSWVNTSGVDMLDAMALIAALFIGFGLGGVALAAFFYVIDKMQNGGKE